MRILVVDDSPGFLKTTRFLLRQLGHEPVGLARPGEEGLAMAAARAPDVILMDINMPGMDGVETTRRPKSQPGSVPVIAMSFQSDRAFSGRCVGAGCDAFIPKGDLAEALPRVRASLATPGDGRRLGTTPTVMTTEFRDV